MENLEKIHLSAKNFQQNFQQILDKVSNVQEVATIHRRLVELPREYQEKLVSALFYIFKCECWLLKNTDKQDFVQLDIDLRQAAVQFYYARFEEIISTHLKSVLQNKAVSPEELIEEDKDFDFTMTVDGNANVPQPISITIDVAVNTMAPEQMIAWDRFASDQKLIIGQHYTSRIDNVMRIFSVDVTTMQKSEIVEDSISRIKKFFDGDYDIIELDKGGMGAILKLTAKHNPTILSLRPENVWARREFAKYLKVRQESIYAQIPKETEFVVKVAFEGHEEALIQESALLTGLAEDSVICETIIGAVQHGRVFAVDGTDKECLGYYLMLEFAPEGNAEQLYKKFPDGRLTPTVAFAMMYGLVRTLQKLKRKGIIHRDIKPLNVLLSAHGIPKLSDFGLSITTTIQSSSVLTNERRRLLRIVDEQFLKLSRERQQTEIQLENLIKRAKLQKNEELIHEIRKLQFRIPTLISREEARADELKAKYRPISAEENALRNIFEASIYYASPEQFEPTNVLTLKTDVYQLGAVMFTMFTGLRPISGKNLDELVDAAMNPNKAKVNDIIKGNPLIDEISDLIYKMITFNHEKRIDIDEVRDHMDQILFSQVLELKKQPEYTMPPEYQHPEDQKYWNESVAFAKKLHSICMANIFDSILHG